MTTRDDIALQLHNAVVAAVQSGEIEIQVHTPGIEFCKGMADRIMPLVCRAQAEALREAAGWARLGLGDATSGHTSTYSVRKWLHECADRIEKEGAGA